MKVYYGRKSNCLENYNGNSSCDETCFDVLEQSEERDICTFENDQNRIRRLSRKASTKFANQEITKSLKRNPIPVYNKGGNVMIR